MLTPFNLRAYSPLTKSMAYLGEPDLETMPSFMHHYADCPLMLGSGRFDVNGKEVFQGDLIECEWKSGGNNAKFFIDFRQGTFVCIDTRNDFDVLMDTVFECCDITIIGNIYE